MKDKVNFALYQMQQAANGMRLIIETLKEGQTLSDVDEVYQSIVFNRLEEIQMLTLRLTEMISAGSDLNGDGADGSAFAGGDLTVVKEPEAEE